VPGKLDVYNLGGLGVVIDKSPIHTQDGELLTAQNAQIDRIGVIGGIRLRDGMVKLNAAALAGPVVGSIAIPLPDDASLAKHWYQPVDDGGGAPSANFRTASAGSGPWATTSSLAYPRQRAQLGAFAAVYSGNLMRYAQLNGKYYYPGNDYVALTTNPTIHMWDGKNDYKIATIGDNPYSAVGTHPQAILSIIPYDGTHLLMTTWDDNTGQGRGRFILLDITNGRMTQLGPQSDQTFGVCLCPIVYQGKIWSLPRNGGGGAAVKGYWVRPSDLTWTKDTDSLTNTTAAGYIHGCVVWLGNLWFGSMADTGASAVLRMRDNLGAYTTKRTVASTTLWNYIAPLIVSQDGSTLFVYENLNDVTGAGTNTAAKQRILATTDGTTFTTEYDVGVQLNNSYQQTGMPIMDKNGDIFWPMGNLTASATLFKLLKRTAGGVWSVVDGASSPVAAFGNINFVKY